MNKQRIFSLIKKIHNYFLADVSALNLVHQFQGASSELAPNNRDFFYSSQPKITAYDFDFMAPEVEKNPYPYYEILRDQGGIHFLPKNDMWLFLNHKEVVAALKQPNIFSSSPMSVYDNVLLGATPLDHKRARNLLMPYFSAQSVAKLSEYIETETKELLEQLRQKEQFDAVSEFVNPLVEKVIARFIDLEPTELYDLKQFILSIDENRPDRFHDEFPIVRQFFERYLSGIDQKSSDNFCRKLLRGEDEQDNFTIEEVISLMGLFWVAGTKTTQEALGKSIFVLLQNPSIKRDLENDLTLIPKFFEEVLRFEPPVRAVYRTTLSDIEISGRQIPSGAKICLCIEAVNRDPNHFSEPDRFIVERNSKDHLTFSFGIHYCIGALLARLKAGIILEILLTNFQTLSAVNLSEDQSYNGSPDFRTLRELIVTIK